MDITLIIIGLVILASLLIIFVMQQNRQLRSDLKQDFTQTAQLLDQRQGEMLRSLDQASVMIGGMREGLGSVREIGKQMGSLQDFLRSPKLRGNLGETILRELLSDHLPKDSFVIQNTFKDGNTVDAVIKIGSRLLPIDAKFPLENARKVLTASTDVEYVENYKQFRRDVKKHIDDVCKKYILPDENTTDFAFLYIPSESIWYQAVGDDDELTRYARGKNVYLVSPNSFYYALQIVMRIMEDDQTQEKIHQVLAMLQGLRRGATNFAEHLNLVNRHLSNARKAMDSTMTNFEKLNHQISGVSALRLPKNAENNLIEKEDENITG
jgi:DNA recombination protein RmuC